MLRLYLTMGSLILAGIANMIFTKTTLYKKYSFPIDFNKTAWDKKPIFGKNKTWIGFFSMIVFCIFFQVLCGIICNLCNLNQYNDLFRCNENTIPFNSLFSFLVGFTYMFCELPNSFIKRRIGIEAGKTNRGFIGAIFFILDQIDSLLGVMLILALFTDIGFIGYLQYLTMGAVTHITVNLILFSIKIRKNI